MSLFDITPFREPWFGNDEGVDPYVKLELVDGIAHITEADGVRRVATREELDAILGEKLSVEWFPEPTVRV